MQTLRNTHRSAFTLIEMLVVIAIIALLAAITVPSVNKALDRSKAVTCASNLRQLGQGFLMYANDNDGRLPYQQKDSSTTWHIEIAPYLEGFSNKDFYDMAQEGKHAPGVFRCPASKNLIRSGNYSDFGMNFLVNDHGTNGQQQSPQRALFHIPVPAQVILLGDSVNVTRRLSPYSANGALDPRHPGGRVNILYVDGHVNSHTVAEIHGDIQGNRATQTPWGWEGWTY